MGRGFYCLPSDSSTFGNASSRSAMSASGPVLIRMQRFKGATPGMRMKMPWSAISRSTIARAKTASLPQSTVTKFVADGRGFNPLRTAIPAIRTREAAILSRTSAR